MEGKLVTAEEFGNYHYGYIGSSIGNSSKKLKVMGGAVQTLTDLKKGKLPSNYDSYMDDPRDAKNIQSGADGYANTRAPKRGGSKFDNAYGELRSANSALSSGDLRGATNALKRALNSLNNTR